MILFLSFQFNIKLIKIYQQNLQNGNIFSPAQGSCNQVLEEASLGLKSGYSIMFIILTRLLYFPVPWSLHKKKRIAIPFAHSIVYRNNVARPGAVV